MNSFIDLELPANALVEQHKDKLFVTKWNWNYLEALEFQKRAQAFIQENRSLRVYIFCNHPHCFTLGRGNERGNDELISFESDLAESLNYPVHKIHRGGGITFHYPGQWIFYPIVAVNDKFSLDDLMCWMLKSVKENLSQQFDIDGIVTAKKLMGVWKDKRKMASIGLGLNRFVTEHGLALNLSYDEKMFKEILKINPCGMKSETYISADKFTDKKDILNSFNLSFKERFLY